MPTFSYFKNMIIDTKKSDKLQFSTRKFKKIKSTDCPSKGSTTFPIDNNLVVFKNRFLLFSRTKLLFHIFPYNLFDAPYSFESYTELFLFTICLYLDP